jgi:hypothetical protein
MHPAFPMVLFIDIQKKHPKPPTNEEMMLTMISFVICISYEISQI